MRLTALLLAPLSASLALGVTSPRPLPSSALRVREASGWRTWWSSDRAPAAWRGTTPLADAARWRRGAPGVEWAELQLAGTGEAWRTRLVVARVDPRVLRLALDTAFTASPRRPAWDASRPRAGAVFAVNAGQFEHTLPWGLVVLDGREMLPAGSGPLASAFVVDSAGAPRWLHGDAERREVETRRAAWAFQSYPTLLRDGEVPVPLREDSGLLNVSHRDARAAIGTTSDGRILVAITRFDALGGRLAFVPFGLTVPEMAAVMGALGARDAMMLDGGISAQLMVRDASGRARTWEGVRRVPMGLVGYRR